MAKPRIIIADTDYRYIAPLQLKFAEAYFDKIDLEIISDRDFLHTIMESPQKADILIIAEELYDSDFLRHDIGNIFLMSEQLESEETAPLGISRLFKYTSIKEIFNEITGKCSDILDASGTVKKRSQIIVVCSAAGGTGKTTVAMGVAACLTKNYKRVLYINADRLQSFQRFLENKNPISSPEIYAAINRGGDGLFEEIQHVIRREIFSYLPPFRGAIMSLGVNFGVYCQLAEAAKKSGKYDYVIVDANTGFDEDMASLLKVADKVMVVTGKNAAAIYATNLFVSNVNGISSEKYLFICNDCAGEEDAAPSPDERYTVSEYIEHFPDYDGMKCEDYVKINGMQKTAFLMV